MGNLIARLDCDDDAIIGHLKDCGKRQRRGYSVITGMLYGMADEIRKLPGASGASKMPRGLTVQPHSHNQSTKHLA